MREREFELEQKKEAEEFAASVNGSVCPITIKTVDNSPKYKKELVRIRKFGYGT